MVSRRRTWPHAYSVHDLTREYEKERSGPERDRRHRFAKDRDRILYSSAFRRLAGKTQVVHSSEPGGFHTRLTHTLKVAQVGRRIAEQIQIRYYATHPEPKFGAIGVCDPELVEAACLAHDLGHPPFGHIGERALGDEFDRIVIRSIRRQDVRSPKEYRRLCAQRSADRGGFEGNAQSLRIITFLAVRGDWPGKPYDAEPMFHGLNLCRATLDATIKYPTPREPEGPASEKWGIFPEDKHLIEWIWSTKEDRPPGMRTFEADVMNWADDVAYAVHDVMDFYCVNLIPLTEYFPKGAVIDDPPEAVEIVASAIARRKGWHPDKVIKAWAALVPWMGGLPSRWTQSRRDKAIVQGAVSDLIEFFTSSATWSAGDVPMMRDGHFLIARRADVAEIKTIACYFLKELVHTHVIRGPALNSQQLGQQRIVAALLQYYYEHGDVLLPDDRREELRARTASGDPRSSQLRAAADFVASLTERDAFTLYRRLLGVNPGAITDRI